MFPLTRPSLIIFFLLAISTVLIFGQYRQFAPPSLVSNPVGHPLRYFLRPSAYQLYQYNQGRKSPSNIPNYRNAQGRYSNGFQFPDNFQSLIESKNPLTMNFTKDFYHNNKGRPFLFNILYGNFNFHESPPPNQTTHRPTTGSTTTPMAIETEMATALDPFCQQTECGCCMFSSMDPNYPGYTGIRSPNFPNDYDDGLNCGIKFGPSLNFTCHFTTLELEAPFDLLMFIPHGYKSEIVAINGYHSTRSVSFSFDKPVLFEVKILSGSNEERSVSAKTGPRKWEMYCLSS